MEKSDRMLKFLKTFYAHRNNRMRAEMASYQREFIPIKNVIINNGRALEMLTLYGYKRKFRASWLTPPSPPASYKNGIVRNQNPDTYSEYGSSKIRTPGPTK